ncbi:hypothetical protein EW146_g8319 [Bondarzewia mesenterica]|uniref:Uncharacterized protein n=1 Tax=Bondarzewia mesenterica TaxID=1095465 RepID=A0A4S4LFE5_9AGAM|nr:hypothetical protein EW146_g8319 [Bondarzewia mesenterica]
MFSPLPLPLSSSCPLQEAAIDNHAHPLLSAPNRASVPFEGLVSEASDTALDDVVQTLAYFRATIDLAPLYSIKGQENVTWDESKRAREKIDYEELCGICFEPAKIHCLLLDDGLGGVQGMCDGYQWHDRLTAVPTQRIVRVEIVAQLAPAPSTAA